MKHEITTEDLERCGCTVREVKDLFWGQVNVTAYDVAGNPCAYQIWGGWVPYKWSFKARFRVKATSRGNE